VSTAGNYSDPDTDRWEGDEDWAEAHAETEAEAQADWMADPEAYAEAAYWHGSDEREAPF